jgi:hypothetical protein
MIPNSDTIAAFLLAAMPFAVGFKTLAFLILSVIMVRQYAGTALGRWIVRMFLVTTLMSLIFTDLAWYLSTIANPARIDSPQEWFLVIGLSTVPFAVSWCGAMIALANFRLDKETEQQHFDDVGMRSLP